MELEFDLREGCSCPLKEKDFLFLMEKAFSYLKVKQDYSLSLDIVGEEEITSINRDYRGIDRPTDVISFAFNDDKSELGLIKGDAPRLLGEILICDEKAFSQAKEYGHSPEREFSFLFVHGLLHLLGYDHMKKEDEEVMFPLQEKILSLAKEER